MFNQNCLVYVGEDGPYKVLSVHPNPWNETVVYKLEINSKSLLKYHGNPYFKESKLRKPRVGDVVEIEGRKGEHAIIGTFPGDKYFFKGSNVREIIPIHVSKLRRKMQTLRIRNKRELFKSLDSADNLWFKGNIHFDIPVAINGFIKASGDVTSTKDINVGLGIMAFGDIKVSGNLKSNWNITCNGNLKVMGCIESRLHITAERIETSWYILSQSFDVRCKSFRTKKLPFHRNYYSVLMPKFADIVNNAENCWPDLLKKLKPHSKEILAHKWHPLIHAQIEMFLGVKEIHKN